MNLKLGDTQKILAECKAQGVLRNQAAYILATAYWETNRTVKPVQEAYWLSESWRRKNLRYYPWHGRGYVQLTWERNYIRAQRETGFPVHDNPKEAMKAGPACAILVKGSMQGWFTGRKISNYITLKKSDFHNARRVINGRDKASTIAKIARQYDNALKLSGYGEETEGSPALIPNDTVKPKVHKSLVESKEMIGSVAALVAAVSGFFEQIDSSTIMMVLAAAGIGFLANRLYARWKDER